MASKEKSNRILSQADQNIPFVFFLAFGGFFVVSIYLIVSVKTYIMIIVAIFTGLVLLFLLLIEPLLKLYLYIGPYKEEIAIVDVLGDSVLNYGPDGYYPCLYMHLKDGIKLRYEFGRRLPKKAYRKGDLVHILAKGKIYNPVEKL